MPSSIRVHQVAVRYPSHTRLRLDDLPVAPCCDRIATIREVASSHRNHTHLRPSFGQRAPSIGSWLQVLLRSIPPVVNDASASFGAKASARRPRCARSETKENTMRVLTITELMRLTRI